jgi:hypothetical protein
MLNKFFTLLHFHACIILKSQPKLSIHSTHSDLLSFQTFSHLYLTSQSQFDNPITWQNQKTEIHITFKVQNMIRLVKSLHAFLSPKSWHFGNQQLSEGLNLVYFFYPSYLHLQSLMILGFEKSQIRLKLQVTAWCAIKLKDSGSTGLTQLLWTISAQPRLLCASVSLLIKNKLYPKSMTTHTFSKHKESPKNTLNQGRHVQMSYREGFIDLIVVNL